MSTATQILANQSNAQHSTGPRTPEGIAACRFNATKHGLSGQQIVIKGEDPAQYDELRASFQAHYKAGDEAEAVLVEQISQSYWRLQRAYRIEARITAELGESAIFTDPVAIKKYANFMRHRNSVERSWKYATKELERLQTERVKRQAPMVQLAASRRPAPAPLNSGEAQRNPNDPNYIATPATQRPPSTGPSPIENGSVL